MFEFHRSRIDSLMRGRIPQIAIELRDEQAAEVTQKCFRECIDAYYTQYAARFHFGVVKELGTTKLFINYGA